MENKRKWNKFLGISSALILIATVVFAFSSAFDGEEKKTTKRSSESSAQASSAQASSESKNTEDSKVQNQSSSFRGVSREDWNLILVGPFHKTETEISQDQLTAISANGEEKLDSRITENYQQLTNAAEAAGFPLVAVSAFRSISSQEDVFNESLSRNKSQYNLSDEEAFERTKETVTEPGYSEHHTGLAVDVVDSDWYNNYSNFAGEMLDARYGEQPGAKWLAENVAKYGFIIRYLNGKEAITGITYEPWHLRYVGIQNAEYITGHNLTLEEYLDLLDQE